MEEHISAMREAHQRYNETVRRTMEDLKFSLELVMENIKQAHDRLYSEEGEELEFLRMKIQQIEEKQAAFEGRAVNCDLAWSEDRVRQELKDTKELRESIRTLTKDFTTLNQCFKSDSLNHAQPDPKKSP